jgi:hypothetical protein
VWAAAFESAAANSNNGSPSNRRRRFIGCGVRGSKEKTQDPEMVRRQAISSASFLYHQYSLHGNALVMSMLIHEVVQQTKMQKQGSDENANINDNNDNDNPRHIPLRVIFEVVLVSIQ